MRLRVATYDKPSHITAGSTGTIRAAVEYRLEMALEDKAYEAVASSTTVSERDDGHSEAFAVFDSEALDCNRWRGHLFSSLWAFGGRLRQRRVGEPLHARCG